MTPLWAILALMRAWINKIFPESSILPYHSFSKPVYLLRAHDSLHPPLTVTWEWRIFCKHSPDERRKWKLCLPYYLINHSLTYSMLIHSNIMKICMSFWQIYYIQRSIFCLDQQQTQYEPFQLSCPSQRPTSIGALGLLNVAPILCHVVTSKCSNIYTYLLHLEESYAGAHDFIHVVSALFGQHQGVVNVMSVVQV